MLLIPTLLPFTIAHDKLINSLSGQLDVLVKQVASESGDKVRMRIVKLEAMANKFPAETLKSNSDVERYFRDSPSLFGLIDDLYLFSVDGILLVDWPIAPGPRG